MSETQILAVSLAIPNLLAVMMGILINNSRLSDLRSYIDARLTDVDKRFNAIDTRFDHVDRRFDDMRDMWRSELRRVEEILDARLKHLEERIH